MLDCIFLSFFKVFICFFFKCFYLLSGVFLREFFKSCLKASIIIMRVREDGEEKDLVWKEIRKMYRGSGNWTEVCSNGEWGTGGSHQKVPDARKTRGSQDPIGMRLVEILNKGEGEPYPEVRQGPCLGDVATHSSPNF